MSILLPPGQLATFDFEDKKTRLLNKIHEAGIDIATSDVTQTTNYLYFNLGNPNESPQFSANASAIYSFSWSVDIANGNIILSNSY